MTDVQMEPDRRGISIDRVGVRNVSCPVTVEDMHGGTQSTVASVAMSVMLPHDRRGTHMSRFVELLGTHCERISPERIEALAGSLMSRLDASESSVKFDFPYFVKKKAPVSGMESIMRYNASVDVSSKAAPAGCSFDTVIGVRVGVQTLCPCSREISDYGAHNQRAEVSVRIRSVLPVFFEELIGMAEESASSPLNALLKREDEKYVTEHAYDKPRFVEDVVREMALRLDADERISWYSLSVSSMESIHDHDAFAEITRDKAASSPKR